MEQRSQQFQDLRTAVGYIKLVDETTPLEQIYYTMWLLETNRLPFGGGSVAAKSATAEHPFIVIARAMNKLFPETEPQYQVYWIAKAVFGLAAQDIDVLVAQTYSELENYDETLLR